MRLPGRKYDRHFFLAIILLQVAVVVIGFGPACYMAGVVRAPLPSPIVHIHEAGFSMWMLLLLVQSGLISARRVGWHRKLGVPNSEPILASLIVPVTDAFDFAVLIGLPTLFGRTGRHIKD